jgi:hypothetical protein
VSAARSLKRGYTEQHAREVLQSAKFRGRPECRTYECPDCGQWHLTSKPDREEFTSA